MMRRSWIIVAVIAAFAIGGTVSVCMGTESASGEITFASFQSGQVVEHWQRRFQEFEELTGIRVVHETVPHDPWGQSQDTLMVRVAAGKAPDVVMVSGTWHNALAAYGLFVDVEELAERDPQGGEFLEDFFPGLRDGYRLDGRLYGLPSDFDLSVSWYNKDYFDDAGVMIPDGSWDWTEFADVGQKLTRMQDDPGDTIWGVTGAVGLWPLFMFAWQNGGDIISEDRKSLVCDAPAVVEALEFMYDLADRYQVTPMPGSFYADFTKGQAAILYSTGPWYSWYVLRNVGFQWGIAPVPHNKQKATIGWGSLIAILEECGNKAQAWEFMKWFLSWEEQLDRAVRFAWFPPGITATQQSSFLDDTTFNMTPAQKRMLVEEAAPYSRVPRGTKMHHELIGILSEELGKVWSSEEPPWSALKNMKQRGDALLRQN